jgi:hypothetical protein
MASEVKYSGRIDLVSEDGQSAVVVLDRQVGGIKYAIIGSFTVGRVKLMNGRGRMVKDVRVEGQATVGMEALDALSAREVALA